MRHGAPVSFWATGPVLRVCARRLIRTVGWPLLPTECVAPRTNVLQTRALMMFHERNMRVARTVDTAMTLIYNVSCTQRFWLILRTTFK